MGQTATNSEGTSYLAGLRERLAQMHMSQRKLATGAAALLALGVAYHVMFGANGLTVYMQKRQETRDLQRQMQSLQSENDQLKGHVDRLQNDPDAIEHQAREQLRYTRTGEVIYTLPDATGADKK